MAISDQEFRKLVEAVRTLNGEIGDPQRSKAALRRGQLLEVQKLIAEIKTGADALRRAIEKLNQDIEAINVELVQVKDRVAAAEALLVQLEQSLADLQAAVTQLEGDIEALEQRAATIESTLDAASADIQVMRAELTDTTARSQANATAITALDGRMDAVENRASTLETDLSALSGTVDGIGDDLAGIKAAVGAVTIPPLTASTVAAPPTAAEYNALLADVTAMRTALVNIQSAIST